jgi:hypothetical protein
MSAHIKELKESNFDELLDSLKLIMDAYKLKENGATKLIIRPVDAIDLAKKIKANKVK